MVEYLLKLGLPGQMMALQALLRSGRYSSWDGYTSKSHEGLRHEALVHNTSVGGELFFLDQPPSHLPLRERIRVMKFWPGLDQK